MPQNDDHAQPGNQDLTEDLVAYLDGELDDQRSRSLEETLAHDDRARQELRLLEYAWDALDELPQVEADERFTSSTVEMIALEATEDLAREQSNLPRRRLFRWLAAVAVLLLSATISYGVTSRIDLNGNGTLARDLPLLERLDEYRQIDEFAFLEQLLDEDIFDDPVSTDEE